MERPENEKFTHMAVLYQHPAGPVHEAKDEHCGECVHFIKADPPRCDGVKSPIRAEDWCRRFARKKSRMVEAVKKATERRR